MLPPPDISARYVEENTGRPSKDFYNWIKSLSVGGTGSFGGLPFINVKDYGAVGNGSTDDRAAIVAAVNAAAGGQLVVLPAGNYAISDYIPQPYSNVHLLGAGKGATTVKFLNALSNHGFLFFSGGAMTNCGISNLTIDAGSFVGTGAGVMLAQGITGFYCRNVEIINMGKAGIIGQGLTNFDISDNNITLNTAINTQNNGIICTAALQNTTGKIARNICLHTNIEVDGQYLTIEDNTVTDWKYGGGVVMGPSANSHDNTIRGNICHGGGPGVDADVTYPTGVEVFALRCIISNNICFNNAGNGIVVGGKNCSVTGNVCYDNGQAAHGGDVSGILLQDGGASNRANDCIVTGNNCFNLVGVTQEYGIQVNSACSGYILWPNQLVGNNTAAHNAVLTVATLASASGSGVGARSYVTNATVTTFASVVAGGGGNAVPVVSDGTNWRIG